MYMSRGGELWSAGIDGTGVTALGTNWFLAEGTTGTFFDTFVQIANPSPSPAHIHVDSSCRSARRRCSATTTSRRCSA